MQTTTRYIQGSPVTLPHLRCIDGEYIPPAPPPMSDEERRALAEQQLVDELRALAADGVHKTECARRVGIKETRLGSIARKHGIVFSAFVSESKRAVAYVEQISKDARQVEVARQRGVTRQAVHAAVKRLRKKGLA